MGDLATQRADAAERLTTARRQRGRSVLDGRKVSHEAVIDAREAIDAFDEAEGEAVLLERHAEQARIEALRAGLVDELAELEEKRLALVAEAEATVDKLADTLSAIVDHVDRERKLLSRMGEEGLHGLDTRATIRRLGASVAARLSQMKLPGFARGAVREFGSLNWFHSGTTAKPDWRKTEHLVVTKELMKTIGRKEH